MKPQNPGMHARVAADALSRLVTDVRTGRAEWQHPQTIRQAADALTGAADDLSAALQQMAAALGEHQAARARPETEAAVHALLEAGRDTAAAAHHLRQARRAMH